MPGGRRRRAAWLLPQPHRRGPPAAQWKAVGEVLAERKLLPLVDFAYQGFADGLGRGCRRAA